MSSPRRRGAARALSLAATIGGVALIALSFSATASATVPPITITADDIGQMTLTGDGFDYWQATDGQPVTVADLGSGEGVYLPGGSGLALALDATPSSGREASAGTPLASALDGLSSQSYGGGLNIDIDLAFEPLIASPTPCAMDAPDALQAGHPCAVTLMVHSDGDLTGFQLADDTTVSPSVTVGSIAAGSPVTAGEIVQAMGGYVVYAVRWMPQSDSPAEGPVLTQASAGGYTYRFRSGTDESSAPPTDPATTEPPQSASPSPTPSDTASSTPTPTASVTAKPTPTPTPTGQPSTPAPPQPPLTPVLGRALPASWTASTQSVAGAPSSPPAASSAQLLSSIGADLPVGARPITPAAFVSTTCADPVVATKASGTATNIGGLPSNSLTNQAGSGDQKSLSLDQQQPSVNAVQPGLYVQVLDGMINVSNPGGAQNFAAGQFGFIPSVQQPPVLVPANPGIQFTPPPAFQQPAGAPPAPAGSGTADTCFDVTVYSTPIYLGAVRVVGGEVSMDLDLGKLPAGTHTLAFVGNHDSTAWVVPIALAGSGTALADTGTDAAPGVAIGAGLLVAGLAGLILSRRRRPVGARG